MKVGVTSYDNDGRLTILEDAVLSNRDVYTPTPIRCQIGCLAGACQIEIRLVTFVFARRYHPYMNRWITVVALLSFPAAWAQPSSLVGEWEMTMLRFDGASKDYTRLTVETQGDKIVGTTARGLKLEMALHGSDVDIRVSDKDGKPQGTLTGHIVGTTLSGGGTLSDGKDQFRWTAKRPSAVPAGGPRTLQFTPEKFHNYFASNIAPVMHIFPKDTVETKSVDAGGTDEHGVRRSPGGNPLTGPFYVEGAMPGDTLAVRINRLRLNRDSAGSGDSVVASALNPYYYHDLKFDEKFSSEWKLDRESGVARLAKPTERLKNFQVKLRPMLGCIGVAPPQDQAFRSGYLGPWGGNMDYNEFREGVTLYLPVFQPGALLFLGDGHAAQGDGELTGDALETSTEYSFTVDVIRNKRSSGPRAENEEFRMASGIANSLPEALQQATTNLSQWLAEDFKLDPNEIGIVLGSSIRYDVAEVVDPMVHIVAKIAKGTLEGLK
jgi:amidase